MNVLDMNEQLVRRWFEKVRPEWDIHRTPELRFSVSRRSVYEAPITKVPIHNVVLTFHVQRMIAPERLLLIYGRVEGYSDWYLVESMPDLTTPT